MPGGKLFVFEGLDGAGGETQSKILREFLTKRGKECLTLKYPDYDAPIGKVIYDFLHKKVDFPADVQFVLYTVDFLKDRKRIRNAIKQNKIVVSDRYFTSTIAYEVMKGFPLENGLKLAEIIDLPKPDLVVFLDISPETSIKRKLKEKTSLDRFEEDREFLKNVKDAYHNLIKNKVFAKEWVVIDGEKPIQDVAKDVQKIVLKKF